jgi:hypothetical protein
MPKRPPADPVEAARAARAIAEVCLQRVIHDGQAILDELSRLRQIERDTAKALAETSARAADSGDAISRVRELLSAWDLAAPLGTHATDPEYMIRQCAQQLAEALDPPSWDTADTPNTEQSAATGLDPALTSPDPGIVGDTASYRT